MKKRKAAVFVAVMAAALLILSACGGGGGGTEDLASNEPEAATEAVKTLETAVQDEDADSLTANIPEEGVSANISGTERTYQKSEAQALIDQIKSSTDAQIFNIINRNTSESSSEDGETMVITGEIVEAVSPFTDNQTTAESASKSVQSQYDANNFNIKVPDHWIENYNNMDLFSAESYSSYSSLKNEGVALIYFSNSSVEDSEMEQVANSYIEELSNADAEFGELGIHNFEVIRSSNTTVDNQQAVRIDSRYDSEYKMFRVVMVYQLINEIPYIIEIRIEGIGQVSDTIARKDAFYLINANNNLVMFEYAADSSAFSENNLNKIINSLELK